jgi:hypothetical protein
VRSLKHTASLQELAVLPIWFISLLTILDLIYIQIVKGATESGIKLKTVTSEEKLEFHKKDTPYPTVHLAKENMLADILSGIME